MIDQRVNPLERCLRFKAGIISLSVHVFVFCFVILSFSSHSSLPKPAFVFLGSIFPKTDFVTFSLGSTRPPVSQETFSLPDRRIKHNAVTHITPAKPNYSSSVAPSPQTVLKSNFETQPEERPLDATIDFEPYAPLRLKIDDKN